MLRNQVITDVPGKRLQSLDFTGSYQMREKKQMYLPNWGKKKEDRVIVRKKLCVMHMCLITQRCLSFLYIYLEYAIHFNVYVFLDNLSAWEK